MQIIDYSTPNLGHESRIQNPESRILEVLAASLIFLVPTLILFILAK